ncbi:MAG: bifunctional hydroxymethylpyrimidine kinase/phosphomethylpyrimidine kinase [Candidatus Binatia bacterium]
MQAIYKALTIAGSDSGAGAGIQADLKTFAAFGVYGTSVVTAVTAQNTERVTQILELNPSLVAAQFDAVIQDIGAHALKTGMLANSAIIELVAEKIHEHRLPNLVVDPVMVAKGGDVLLRKDAIETLRLRLIPLATIVTPNLPEAEQLTGIRGNRLKDVKEAARRIMAMGARSVVIKGGHRRGAARDLFYDGKQFRELTAPRIRTANTHGTGCTFSAAIAANLARGERLQKAVAHAKRYITQAIRKGFTVGSGHSPVHHFYCYWEKGRP